MNDMLKCPGGKRHTFVSGRCMNCGLSKKEHIKLVQQSRLESYRRAKAKSRYIDKLDDAVPTDNDLDMQAMEQEQDRRNWK